MLKRRRRVCYLGSIAARPKLKGIGGGILQPVTRAVQSDSTPWTLPEATAGWRSVWRAYLTRWEELHSRRQPVPWGDLLNQVTGKTHIFIYHVYNKEIARVTGMKVWATLGGTVRILWVTRARQWQIQWDATPKGEANLLKSVSVQIEVWNSASWRWNR